MKSLHDLLIHRRSIRKYTQEALSPEAVKTILEAGLLAPSSKRCTPWEFIAVEDKETLARLSECKTSGAKPIAGAALAIVVTADMTLTDTWIEDASIAAILMQLQAADLGLGSCWIQVRGRFGAMDEPAEDFVRETLGIPEEMGVLCILSIGHKDEERKPFDEEKMMWEKVHIGNGNPLHRHEDYSHRSRQFSHAISGRFTKKGMTPAYIYSRTRESAEQLSERLRDVPYSTDISQVPTDGDLYIFAVKDSALLDLVSRMPSNRGLWVHTAGSMDMEVFAPYTARYGVFYPMQTFSKERETDFDDIPIFVETNHTDDTERLQKLAGRLSTKVYEATSEQRKYLHLAAVFACNFSNHLYALCDRILSEHGLPFETMLPLIRETAAKVADMPPAQAQTGPAIRYDKNVIDKQMALLSDPTMRQIYDLMSRSIHETNKH